jgi:hypothetical protein
MPAGLSHIPQYVERTTPQRMSTTEGLPIKKLRPSGQQTVAGMVAKGWIERRSDGQGHLVYCITAAGQHALKAPIPLKR